MRVLVVTIVLLLAACARIQMPAVSPADADHASSRWPGTSVDDLNQGRQLYIARCASCHQPVPPADVPAAEWPGHVAEMKERSKLDDHQADLVVRYLVTMSERASP